MEKYIICDSARGNWGKTTTLRNVLELLKKSSDFSILEEHPCGGVDVWIVFEYKPLGKKVIVQTQGDVADSFTKTENYLNNNIAEIIVCASRAKGKTLGKVADLGRKNGYKIIFFRNFYSCNWQNGVKNVNENFIVKGVYELILQLLK